jgi:hypothetical protein
MWIVKNTLESTVLLEDLGVEVPPGDFMDLDALGRARAEASDDLTAAIQQSRLLIVAKSSDESRKLIEPGRSGELFDELERKLREGKDALVREIAGIAAGAGGAAGAIDTSRIDALLSNFSNSAIAELKSTATRAERGRPAVLPKEIGVGEGADDGGIQPGSPAMKTEFEAFRRLLEEFEMLKDLLRDEVQGLVSEFRKVRGEEAEVGLAEAPRKRPKLTEADFRARAAIISDIERELQKNFQNIGSRVKKRKPKDRGDLVDKLRGL